VRPELLTALTAALDAGRPVVWASRATTGEEALLRPLEGTNAPPEAGAERGVEAGAPGAEAEADWPMDEARRALLEDRSFAVDTPRGEVFLRAYNPPVRVVVVGAVHAAQPLVGMVRTAGYRPVVVDPRTAFATAERFPGTRLLTSWPAEALAEVAPDHRTAVVTLTHDPKLDDPALVTALATPAFYVGALGSSRTHQRRLERLGQAGVGAEALARIHAPVGLDIGARSPEEIAVAILAQIVDRLRRPAS